MSIQKKIVIIGPAYPLRGGGMSTFNERLARAFMAEGHEVRIDTFSLQYPSFLFPGTSQYSTEAPPKDLNIATVINSVNPLNWFRVGNDLRKERPNIIVIRYWLPFMGPCFGTILRIVKKNKFTKVICIADNVIPHEKGLGDKSFTKYFIKPIDAFITMSTQVLDDLRIFTSSAKALYIPHPLYDNFGEKISLTQAREDLQIAPLDFVLLFFGFIRKYKGLDILLDALALIGDKIPRLQLIVAGEFYDDQKTYEVQIERLGLHDKVQLHNKFITDAAIRSYFCAANVVVQPYRHATQSGVTPLAYHFETPIIVTNVGGLAALVPDGIVGLVAEPTASSLAEKILLFYQTGGEHFHPGLINEKKKYSWKVMTDAIIELAETTGKSV